VLYPALGRLRQVTARVAEAVVREARDRGLGRPLTDAEIPAAVASAMWEPLYPAIEAV
jgi:malate dehydrogenase (oxaloacetate-decarboxylating)